MEKFNGRYLEFCKYTKNWKVNIKSQKNIYVYHLILNNNTSEFMKMFQETGVVFDMDSAIHNGVLYSFSFFEALKNKNKIICDVLYAQVNQLHDADGHGDYRLLLLSRITFIDDPEALKYMIEILPNTFPLFYRHLFSITSPKIYEYLFNTYIKDEDYVIPNDPEWRDKIFYSLELFSDRRKTHFQFEMSILDDFISIGYPRILEAGMGVEWSIEEMLFGLLTKQNRQMMPIPFDIPLTWKVVSRWFRNDYYVDMIKHAYSQIYSHFESIHVNIVDDVAQELHILLRTAQFQPLEIGEQHLTKKF